MTRIAMLFATFGLLAACAGGDAGTTITAGADPTASPGSTPPPGDGIIGDVPPDMIESVIQQASEETGVTTDEISVLTAEAVTWSDGSLGCPEPGMAYTQALVPGYRVILNVGGEEIHFHAGQDGEFFPCDDPQEPLGSGTVDR